MCREYFSVSGYCSFFIDSMEGRKKKKLTNEEKDKKKNE
jgi:hypothetical protein